MVVSYLTFPGKALRAVFTLVSRGYSISTVMEVSMANCWFHSPVIRPPHVIADKDVELFLAYD